MPEPTGAVRSLALDVLGVREHLAIAIAQDLPLDAVPIGVPHHSQRTLREQGQPLVGSDLGARKPAAVAADRLLVWHPGQRIAGQVHRQATVLPEVPDATRPVAPVWDVHLTDTLTPPLGDSLGQLPILQVVPQVRHDDACPAYRAGRIGP